MRLASVPSVAAALTFWAEFATTSRAMSAQKASGDPLDKYRSMRDFGATPEPAGEKATEPAFTGRFVIQEHHATSLHWDLRLEHEGVLASWAVPKGIPPDPRVNNLAVHTEDHPMEYLDFHGEIPEGNYGAGRMFLWDTGTYDCLKWQEDEAKGEVMFELHGERARGKHVLFRTGGNQWMLHRMDPAEDPSRELVPEGWRPMRPTRSTSLPAGGEWAYEVEWPGRRVVVAVDGGRADAWDNSGDEVSDFWPELSQMAEEIGALQVVLDGVLVVPTRDGGFDTAAAERRVKPTSASAVRRLAVRHPAVFMAIDVLWLDGHAAVTLAWEKRRTLLERLELKGPAWQTPPVGIGERGAIAGVVEAQGLPGVVAKRTGSIYEPGGTSTEWVVAPPG